MKKLFSVLLGLCLTVYLAAPAMAADGYTYTVRIYAGAQGTFGGSSELSYEGLSEGAGISFNPASVTLKNSEKYYVKGIRESGGDTSSDSGSYFQTDSIEGDTDYVVVYGIRGESVAYTVNYQDQDGNELLPSQTFYGSIGDRPVVAFQYVEGYQPQAYNLVGTLSDNAAENVFTFVYTPVAAPATAAPATATPSPSAAATAAPAEGEDPAAPEETTVPEDEDNPAPVEIIEPNDVPAVAPNDENAPEDTIDIDENQVPLASATELVKEFAQRVNDIPTAGKVSIASSAVLLLGVIWWLLFYRRRKRI